MVLGIRTARLLPHLTICGLGIRFLLSRHKVYHMESTLYIPDYDPGLKINPRLIRPFMMPTRGEANLRCRTQPCSPTAGCALSHSQSTKPSPASGFTVK